MKKTISLGRSYVCFNGEWTGACLPSKANSPDSYYQWRSEDGCFRGHSGKLFSDKTDVRDIDWSIPANLIDWNI